MWSSLFFSALKVRETFPCFTPVVVDDISDASVESEDQGVNLRSEYLIGYFVGGKLSYNMVQATVEKQWNTKLKSMAPDQELFFFKFNSKDEIQVAIE